MCCSDTVRTSITTTDDEYILTFGSYALILTELHACQHAVLLGEELEGEMYAFEFAAWSL